jgi:hypothetical protein
MDNNRKSIIILRQSDYTSETRLERIINSQENQYGVNVLSHRAKLDINNSQGEAFGSVQIHILSGLYPLTARQADKNEQSPTLSLRNAKRTNN